MDHLAAAAFNFFAQTAAPEAAAAAPAGSGTAAGSGPFGQMLMFYGLIAAGFYFLLIAPQRKKQKEHEKMLSALQTGDDVLTTGGLFGTITNVKDDRFVVRIADNTKVEIAKGHVQAVVKRDGPADKK